MSMMQMKPVATDGIIKDFFQILSFTTWLHDYVYDLEISGIVLIWSMWWYKGEHFPQDDLFFITLPKSIMMMLT